jgi:flagellar hook-basal body complex protein FliE
MKVESSFASQLYAAARRIAPVAQQPAGATTPAEGGSFAEALAAAVGELSGTLGAGEQAARQAILGQGDVQAVVEALTATELALETAVAVRDKVVEAYQEILRMPV